MQDTCVTCYMYKKSHMSNTGEQDGWMGETVRNLSDGSLTNQEPLSITLAHLEPGAR